MATKKKTSALGIASRIASKVASNVTKGTLAGVSSGIKSSSSSGRKRTSSSSKSSSSSRGTTINGKTYGTSAGGYQTDINRAVANGDYVLAAKLEQARNNKIDTTGSTQSKTNLYSGWLPGSTDYSSIGRQQMDSGASWQDVLNTYNARADKAANTVGMEKFVNDAKQQEMLNYILTNMNQQQEVPAFDYQETRPTYESKYDSRIDDLLNQILNRDKFSYDAANDPLFAQYQSQYQREGNRAMNDTLASAAAGAGGMNSYAITAAQQANDYYNAQIGDKIPELYQLAYQMYLKDIDNDVQNMGILQDMDTTQYNRYRDTMSDWHNDRNFAYNQYRDDVADNQWLKQFNYNSLRDNIADQRYDQEWDYNVGRDQIADQRYNTEWDYSTQQNRKEQAYSKAMDLLEMGVMPDTATLEASGITAAEASAYIAARKAKEASKVSSSGGSRSSGGSSGSSGSSGYTGKKSTSSGNGYVPVSNLNSESNGSGYTGNTNNTAKNTADISKPVSTTLSASAQKKLNSLKLMQDQTGSKQAIANSIAVYADTGEITDAEARYMFQYFGYDPNEWLE